MGADGLHLFTRKQAARTLGVHVKTVIKWAQNRTLVPARNVEGVHLYTREQIDLMRRDRVGKIASEAFALFELGKTAVQVVIELGVEPDTIERMHASYVKLSSSWVVKGPSGPLAAWEATYRLGPITPEKLRRALELCASHPALREKLIA